MALLRRGGQHQPLDARWAARRSRDSPDEDHLLLQLAVLIELGADLPVEAALGS